MAAKRDDVANRHEVQIAVIQNDITTLRREVKEGNDAVTKKVDEFMAALKEREKAYITQDKLKPLQDRVNLMWKGAVGTVGTVGLIILAAILKGIFV